jgi:phospho-N-acetylmuramoyl-pentapeptide-transferase
MVLNFILAGVVGLVVALLLCYPVLLLCKKLKFSQTILHYVKEHSGKSGTPTMGGIIFIFAGIMTYAFFSGGQDLYTWLSLVVMLAYGLIGFLDDFIKIKFHQNKGLSPWQKIIGQVAIAIIVALFVYFKVGTSLDFFGIKIELGWGIIPFVVFVFLAITNSVNLTDGLDGLAGGVSAIYLLFFGAILTITNMSETNNLAILCFIMFGAILGFLAINSHPAKIFMGDTGSLALGGVIACISIFSGKVLLMPIMGLMFVLSALSVVLQVAYFKKTKKRIFLMAPLHHHFEKKGVHENRIVTIYIIVTGILSACCLCLELAL